MKTLRRLCAVFSLTLAFALPVFAGTISTGVVDPPPPPPDSQETVQGDMPTGVTATDSATEALLNLLQSLLSLF